MVGNLSNFTKIDVLRCLFNLENPVSRTNLSYNLDLGEGTIRSILDILKKNNFLDSDKKGHSLNDNGLKILGKVKNSLDMVKVSLNDLFPGKKKIAAHIKNIKNKNIGKSYELRDIALKNGADGALILTFNEKLELYDYDDSEMNNFEEIEGKFKLNNDDLVIIAYADSYRLSEHGGLAVAIELSDSLKVALDKLK